MTDKVRRQFPEMQCFVLMPFGTRKEYGKARSEADFIYRNIILPAIEKSLQIEANEKTVVREVDNSESGLITKSMIQRIAEAPLVIADITGHNANVFFEMGVRYSLRRSGTILIRQPDAPIPFDLANFRHHTYELLAADAKNRLADAITATLSAGNDRTDSPVFEVFPALEVQTNSANELRMPWYEFRNRIDVIREHIMNASTEGTYCPDAMIGITKGGAMFADMLTQKMPRFRGATLALWADRDNDISKLFDHPINRKLLAGLKEHTNKECGDLRILLLDKIVASGVTYKQSVKLVMDVLPGCHLRFLPMVYRENRNYEVVADRILWKHHAFRSKFNHDDINQIHQVNWIELPWGKDIRRS